MSMSPPASANRPRPLSTAGVMTTVLIALTPATALHLWFAGPVWALTLLVCCATALLLEALALRLRGRDVAHGLQDGSVLVTCVLLLLLLPATAPWWCAVIGTSIAVVIGKHLFGGLGHNLFNPALVGYLGLLTLFPQTIAALDTGVYQNGHTLQAVMVTLALTAGGIYLLMRRIIGWHIPATMLLATALSCYLFDTALISTTAALAAFFIATDPVTTPGTRRGKLLFGLMAGLITGLMTTWLPFPMAVATALLTLNAAVPTLDQLIKHDRKRTPKAESLP